ncbi:hypothetical protein PybrP1_006411 [[Pythium] brassicae (nom. inval.)]|nr:hypothetical protein PybrP1_006411 [[Pythium] brassicae (nom. inval.)]
MGKKKRHDDADGASGGGGGGSASSGSGSSQRRIFCYYCERTFDDEQALILHQKARHFKCPVCHKKLSTGGGMLIHMQQVHKEALAAVPNAKPGRDSVDLDIYGMQGVPDDSLASDAKKPRLEAPPPPVASSFPPRPIAGFPMRPPPPHLQAPPGMVAMRPPPVVSMAFRPPPRLFPGGPMGPSMGMAPGPWRSPAGGAPPMATGPTGSSTPVEIGTYAQSLAALEPAGAEAPAPQRKLAELGLIYRDDLVSMEEKRALRPTYRYKPALASAASSVAAE